MARSGRAEQRRHCEGTAAGQTARASVDRPTQMAQQALESVHCVDLPQGSQYWTDRASAMLSAAVAVAAAWPSQANRQIGDCQSGAGSHASSAR